MKHINGCLVAFVILITISCNRAESHHHASANHMSVQLNDGKKWMANPETTNGIYAMRQILADLPNNPEQQDCQKLKSDLQIEFGQIIEKCTMEGEAHNQLHNFLMPLAEEIDQLDQAASCNAEIKTIRHTLNEYSTYFN